MMKLNRNALWRIVVIALLLALILPLTATAANGLAPANYAPPEATSFKVITLDNAKLRTGPGSTYAVIMTLPFGTELLATGRDGTGTWIFVTHNGTQQGWIYYSLLEYTGPAVDLPVVDTIVGGGGGGGAPAPTPVPPGDPTQPPPSGPVTVTTKTTMNIRQTPSTGGLLIGKVPLNTTLSPTGRSADGQWAFIQYNGMKGWIAAWLATVNGDLNSLPVTTETGCCAPANPGNPPPSPAGGFELGGQTHTLDNPARMQSTGMTWVKFQHKWSPGQNPADLAGRISSAHANGLKVLISIPGPLYPSSIDFNGYVQFVGGVAGHGADAIEIWNEMNLDREWPAGQISPAAYVNSMLAPSYLAIKAANPGTLVISGALAPTGVDNGFSVWSDQRYLAGMAGAGAARYMDCLGVHYNAGATSPDANSGHPADAGDHHYSWYFMGTFNVYKGAFPSTKLCFTEIGYVSGEGYGSLPGGFWWGGGNTVGEQAEWLARAVTISRQSGKVRLFVVFNVDFTYWGDDPQAGYAIIRPGGGCPACDSLRVAMQ
jgi:uncharacterized protein YgiM (DUF1202 family)